MERPQFAYTGLHPEKGYVGYVNIQMNEAGTAYRFTVRSEGEQPVTAAFEVPLKEAFYIMNGAMNNGAGEGDTSAGGL